MLTRGFTLLETVLYLALFSVCMGGVLSAAHHVVLSQRALDTSGVAVEEVVFVMRKLSWMLRDATAIVPPEGGAYSASLTVVGSQGERTLHFVPATKRVEMQEGGVYMPLTTRASVSDMQFRYLPPQGGSPAGVEVSITVGSVTVYSKKFLRI